MSVSLVELNQETDLIGTLTNPFLSNSTQFVATFVDKKTGQARAPQTTTLEFTFDQDNAQSETALCSSVSTTAGITTGIIASNGRNIPKFGTGAGSNTGLDHQIGAAVGCVDIARPLNIIAEALGDKADLSGATFTGLVNFLEPTGLLELPNLTTAERDAIVSPGEGLIIKNITTGTIQVYLGGTWQDLGISTPTPNASTIVSGKVQIATQAQFNAGTATGSTSAFLDAPPDVIQAGIQSGSQVSGTTTGSANTYVLTLAPVLAAYATGQAFRVKINVANTGSSTINISGLGAKTLKKNVSFNLESGDLVSGQIIVIVYDGTNFQVVGGLTNSTYSKNNVNADESVIGWHTNQLSFTGGQTDFDNGTYVFNGGTSVVLKTILGYNASQPGFTGLQFSNNKIVKLKTLIAFVSSGGSNNTVAFGFAINSTGLGGTLTATTASIRFFSDGVNVYSITSNGIGNTNNLLADGSPGWTTPQLWEIVWNPVVPQVQFYINGVLQSTHTTNIPTGNSIAQIGIVANSTGGDTEANILNPILSQQL